MVISKQVLLGRNEGGELLPEEIQIEELGGTIKIVPITRGKIFEMQKMGLKGTAKEDVKLVVDHLVEPKVTEKEIEELSPKRFNAILYGIFEASGIPAELIKKSMTDAFKLKEDELKKK